MKTTKFISALLVPALLVACSDDMFDSNSVGNIPSENLVEGLTINVGFDASGDAATRGTFAGGAKGIFDNFYFEPSFNDEPALQTTDNSAIYGDQVGICLPNPVVGNGGVLTNVPFYIAGYQGAPDGDGNAVNPYSLVAKDNGFYRISDSQQEKAAFEESETTTTKNAFNSAVAALKAGGSVAEGKADISKAIFKTVAGVMTGDYVLYYPYNATFNSMGKIPAVQLKSIQTLEELAVDAGTDNVLGSNLFAYSKTPFRVSGETNAAQDMSMAPAAYFFQFKLYTTGSEITLANDDEIKLITVSTKDDAQAFAIDGFVTAGATNSFTADAETAVDMIGVECGGGVKVIPATTTAKKNTEALTAYLSTYAVKEKLAGKDIIVRVYTEKGKVATFTKTAAGSNIKEGSTDYWNLDFNGKTFEDAEQLVYNEETLTAALTTGGTLVLKNNIEANNALTLAKEVTIKGANYTITASEGLTINAASDLQCGVVIPANKTLTIKANSSINKVTNNGTVTMTGGTEEANLTATIATIENNGAITVGENQILNATTINNNAVKTTAASLTVEAKGSLVATAINNAAEGKDEEDNKLEAAEITITGNVANTTINNAGALELNGAAMASTVTINNTGAFEINTAGVVALNATLVNDGTVEIASTASVNSYGTITNNNEITNNGVFTLLGSGTLQNNKLINDYGTFSGLSRLTNATGAELIRSVEGWATFEPAIAEAKVTAVRINADVESEVAITTTKTIYLNNNLTLPVGSDKASSAGKIVFEKAAGATLKGYITASAMDVNQNGTIAATSNVTVTGDITIASNMKLTGEANSYTICNDIKGAGTTEGPIYVK